MTVHLKTKTLHGQFWSIIERGDAAQALARMLDYRSFEWKVVYNVGTGESVSIMDFASEANASALARNRPGARIVIKPADIRLATGMDTYSFTTDFDWTRRLSIAETYRDLFGHFARERSVIDGNAAVAAHE